MYESDSTEIGEAKTTGRETELDLGNGSRPRPSLSPPSSHDRQRWSRDEDAALVYFVDRGDPLHHLTLHVFHRSPETLRLRYQLLEQRASVARQASSGLS